MHHLRININLLVRGWWGFDLTSNQIPNPRAAIHDQIPYSAPHTEVGMVKDFTSYHVRYALHGISSKVNQLIQSVNTLSLG